MTRNLTTTVAAEHRTVSRVMAIIEAVTSNEPRGLKLAELSDIVGAPKSSVHGLAKGLVALGYLREEDSRYIGGAAISLLRTRDPEVNWRRAAIDELRTLSGKWNETSMTGILTGDSVVYTESVESTQMLRAFVPIQQRVALWPGSSGKCLIAFMTPRRRAGYFERVGVSGDALEAANRELDEVRRTRVAFNIGGTAEGMVGVASPIVIPDRPVTLTIAVTGPEHRLLDHLEELGADVLAAAEALASAAQ